VVGPVRELVTGIWSVSVMRALVGKKLTVIVQVAAGARVLQVVVEVKFGVVLVGAVIWRVAEPVLVRVMVCWVAVGAWFSVGTLLKMRAVGLKARPGSGVPKPVSEAVTGKLEVWMVRAPVRGPVAVGVKMTLMKHAALGARGPLQAGPPVGKVVGSAREKSPVVVGVERETVAAVRLVRVKRDGALVLWTGMGPKSCVMGVRTRPLRAVPVPVRAKGEGVPEVLEVRVRVAVSGPMLDGVNWTPSQQLVQVPVKVVAKAEDGGWPCP
jgi:hypothetical protein